MLVCLSCSSPVHWSSPLAASHGWPRAFTSGYRNPRKEFGWHFSTFGEHIGRKKLLFPTASRAVWGKKRREMIRSLIPCFGSRYSSVSAAELQVPPGSSSQRHVRPDGNGRDIIYFNEYVMRRWCQMRHWPEDPLGGFPSLLCQCSAKASHFKQIRGFALKYW